MPRKKGAHLGFDDRCEIEDMLKEGASFREIARKLEVSPTTVSGEVKLNRVFFKPKSMPAKAQSRCSKYRECVKVALCRPCSSHAAACKRCGKKRCWDVCEEFVCLREVQKARVLHLGEGALRRLPRPGGA